MHDLLQETRVTSKDVQKRSLLQTLSQKMINVSVEDGSPSKSPGRAVRLPENRLSHGTPGKVKFLTKFRIVPKIKKKTEIF